MARNICLHLGKWCVWSHLQTLQKTILVYTSVVSNLIMNVASNGPFASKVNAPPFYSIKVNVRG